MHKMLSIDTRIIEITTSATLLISIILHLFFNATIFTESMLMLQVPEFWVTITLVFAFIQLYCALYMGHADLIRGIVSWFIGSFLMWFALDSMYNGPISTSKINLFVLGLSNMYAFIVNTIISLRNGE